MTPEQFLALLRSAPPGTGTVRIASTEPGVTEIVLDHTGKKNALSPCMMLQLSASVDRPEVRSSVAIILRGEGQAFCSGGDLDAVRDHLAVPGSGTAMAQFMGDILVRLEQIDAVVLGVLDGPALGGGAELLVACDEIFASAAGSFGFVHARLGVTPGFGGGGRLVSKLGTRKALSLLTTGNILRGTELQAIGLVDDWSGDPLVAARARARGIAALPHDAVIGAIRIVRAYRTFGRGSGEQVERLVFSELWGGSEHRRALGHRE